MSISDEISRLSGNISDSFGAVEDMGGTVPQNTNSDNLAAAIRSIPQPDTVTPESIAIVANGNTHGAITKGQYVYVRGHGTLEEGLYQATAAIPANNTLSMTNLSTVSGGGLNALRSVFTRVTRTYTNVTIPSSGYIQVDSYGDMNIDTSKYLISITTHGWWGNIAGITFAKSSTGTDIYMIGPPDTTVSRITAEYVFSDF